MKKFKYLLQNVFIIVIYIFFNKVFYKMTNLPVFFVFFK